MSYCHPRTNIDNFNHVQRSNPLTKMQYIKHSKLSTKLDHVNDRIELDLPDLVANALHKVDQISSYIYVYLFFSRPGRSQGLLYKHLRHSLIHLFIHSVILQLKYLHGAATPQWLEMVLSVIYHNFCGDSKSRRTSKLHYWFKSYGDFAEWVDFSYWTKW